jgi:acyl CoA:acetate/3-ketoacid CoA transferase alpha subunit
VPKEPQDIQAQWEMMEVKVPPVPLAMMAAEVNVGSQGLEGQLELGYLLELRATQDVMLVTVQQGDREYRDELEPRA